MIILPVPFDFATKRLKESKTVWLIIMIFVFTSVLIFSNQVLTPIVDALLTMNEKRSLKLAEKMDRIFERSKVSKMAVFFTLSPVIFGVGGLLFFPSEIRLLGVIIGIIIGFLTPSVYIRITIDKRK